jgi:ATP-dependent protease ClpP protease subunit
MDKAKLKELIKEEVQSLLSEADTRSPSMRIQSVIRRLTGSSPEARTQGFIDNIIEELKAISNELEGR